MHGDVNEWLDYLKKINIYPLRNSNRNLTVGNSILCVAGADDLYAVHSQYVLKTDNFLNRMPLRCFYGFLTEWY